MGDKIIVKDRNMRHQKKWREKAGLAQPEGCLFPSFQYRSMASPDGICSLILPSACPCLIICFDQI